MKQESPNFLLDIAPYAAAAAALIYVSIKLAEGYVKQGTRSLFDRFHRK